MTAIAETGKIYKLFHKFVKATPFKIDYSVFSNRGIVKLMAADEL